MYCVKCRKPTETEYGLSKNGRHMKRGNCAVCGIVKSQFVKATVKGGDIVSSLNSLTKNSRLLGQKFPGELHLPGHNFTGPGTLLDLRLNPDNTPKV